LNEKQPLAPDFLRRFTPTPYIFEVLINGGLVRIESDDLEIALSIRGRCQSQRNDVGVTVRFWRLVRDRHVRGYERDLEVVATGGLRTITHRSGSVLFVDSQKGAVFGFIAMGLTTRELTDRLLPLLLVHPKQNRQSRPFTNK
jgi:hypothetical protein